MLHFRLLRVVRPLFLALILSAAPHLLGEASGLSNGSERIQSAASTDSAALTNLNDIIAGIRDEGFNHSSLMDTLSYLTDVIGPRLTGSPNLKRANEWTRDRLSEWGLKNAHLEAWGPFGRGWSLDRFSVQVVEPQAIPIIACPTAWSPGLEKPIVADVIHLDAQDPEDLDKYKGKLAGAIVLVSPLRELGPRFEPLARRLNETNLLRLANAGPPSTSRRRPPSRRPETRARRAEGPRVSPVSRGGERTSTNSTRFSPGPRRYRSPGRNLAFLAQEHAALVISSSPMGEDGTVFTGAAMLPPPEDQAGFSFANRPRPWSTNTPSTLPQITMATEDYNRIVRILQHGEKVRMAVDFQVRFHPEDLMVYNTIAEIPGSDLKDEIVMLGAHLDSIQSGTGATDNAAGVAAMMEAVRIFKVLKLQPRRTIRIGLWSGEEQGLLGSRAYVACHFGYYTNRTEPPPVRSPKDQSESATSEDRSRTNSAPTRRLVRNSEFEKISVYFNLDNGGGKIRGVYLQGNEAERPLFRRWLQPFRDLDAETITSSNTYGTDHTSFDAVGIPAFQFIQDPLDYMARTHHSNQDVFERIEPDDLRQAAVILATFAYQAATMDERLPRRSTD